VILTEKGAESTPEALQAAQRELASPVGGEEVLWCGRGATALYWAYRVVRAEGDVGDSPEIILPAIACASPVNTAIMAGLTPRFADIDPATGMLTLQTVRARRTPQTRAVLFIHLFGQTADLSELRQWCRRHKITLVEDLAQALGARLPCGDPAGSMGEMSIYSFTGTKILQCGGGALLVRDGRLTEVLKSLLADYRPPPPAPAERRMQLFDTYRNLHRSLVGLKRLLAVADISAAFLPLRPAYDCLYILPLNNADALAEAWRGLPSILQQRLVKAELYEELLARKPFWALLSGWRTSGVCWRYSLLFGVPDQLVPFSEAVRRDGFHVSNLYWELSSFYRPDDACPEAEKFSRSIVNLWVDDMVDLETVRRCCESMIRHGASFYEQASATGPHP